MISPGDLISEALSNSGTEILLLLTAICSLLGVLILWGYVKQATRPSSKEGPADGNRTIASFYSTGGESVGAGMYSEDEKAIHGSVNRHLSKGRKL